MSSFRIIPRSEWGAKYGRGNDVSSKLPWGEVVFHTEAGAIRKQDWDAIKGLEGSLQLNEKQHMQAIENFHVNTRGWQGIAYSFVIMFDGSILEGRGWGHQGAHTETRNTTAAGVCFQGHGDLQGMTPGQELAAAWLIGEGIRLGKLKSSPKISSHSDYSLKGKTCAGMKIRARLWLFKNILGPIVDPSPNVGAVKRIWQKGDEGPQVAFIQGGFNLMILAGFLDYPGLDISDPAGFGGKTHECAVKFQHFCNVMGKLAGNPERLGEDGKMGPPELNALVFWAKAAIKKINK